METSICNTYFMSGEIKEFKKERTKTNLAVCGLFAKQTPKLLSCTWTIYGTHYVNIDIQTNKPPNMLFRLRLSCSVSIQN